MDLLKRELAPILGDAWEAIDAEARRLLKLNLAGRKIVDFEGPYGWHFAAVNTGRLELLADGNDPEVHVGIRRVQPLIEVRVAAHLSIAELDSVGRGAENPDLSDLVRAAEKVARAEDSAIFTGFGPAGIVGIVPASPHAPLKIPENIRDLPRTLVTARETLRQAGISGPYALALAPDLYEQVFAASDDGHPLARRIEQQLVDKPIVRAAALTGGVLASVRGGDYELTVGQDLSVGYAFHDRKSVELYIAESFTFRVLEPAAAVVLVRT